MSLETRITALAQAIAADIKAVRAGLAGKAASGANTDITSITGSAAKLTTARTVATSGDASGSASFDGSANINIPLTLSGTGIAAGTYGLITVDAKGRATAGTIISPIANGGTGASTAAGALANLGAQAALGFTPENSANKGKANGYASLDASGLVPASQLPSYVDDVLEYSAFSAFPSTGETGKIYVALDTGKLYRWAGTTYVYITSGAVDSVNGKTGVVVLAKGDIGLGNVDNTADAAKSVASAAKLTTARTVATSGDATGSASFDGSANVNIPLTLAGTGIAAGTYPVLTVDAKGRATGGRALQVSDLPPSNVAGTWGVVGVDGYGRVTAGRQATAADIVSGILAYARLPVLGQVTSAGSAIVEVGSNANGSWVRLAGGLQICWRTLTTENMAVNPKGLSQGYTWTFPAAFADANWCGFLQNMSGWAYDYSLGFEGKNAAYMASIYVKNLSDQAHQQNHNIQCFAVGRCYY